MDFAIDRMKILMLLNEEFPPDFRVEKEAKSLIEAGHQVHLLCYTAQHKPREENHQGILVKRFQINRSLRDKLFALYLVLPFFRWIWRHQLNKALKHEQYDALHIHDLPMSDLGVHFKKKYNLKLVCDQHEYYSNWIGQNAHMNTPVGRIVKKLSNWEKYEKKNLKQADLVISVEEPLRKVYVQEVGIPDERAISLPNTPPRDFPQTPLDQNILETYKDHFVLFYVGGIDILRGIDVAIHALPKMVDSIPNVKLVLAGKVWKNHDPVDMAKKLGVREYVDFVGWVSPQVMPSYIAASDVCFHVPPAHNEEINRTIQTKIYQYLHMGKPVIVGQSKMVREFITRNQLGYAIRERDSDDFADKVIHLYKNPSILEESAKRAREVASNYFWENTVQDLLNFYNQFSPKIY